MTQQDNPDETRSGSTAQKQQPAEQAGAGHSGEGSASALAHMISQVDRRRHQAGEADDAAGHAQ